VRASENLTLKIYQKAYDTSAEGWGGNTVLHSAPRMASLRSSGIPVHKLLLPSTMVRHSSRATCSASAPAGRRCASNVFRASRGVPGDAGGIKRTRRERMSPARCYHKCGMLMTQMRLQLVVSASSVRYIDRWGGRDGKRKLTNGGAT
jgi:hypothetical protein